MAKKKNQNKRKVSTANELFADMMCPKQVTYRSVRKWMIRPEHVEDAMAELVMYLWNKYQNNIEELIEKYNHSSQWIGFISLYSRNQLQNLDSAFARKYYNLRHADVSNDNASQDEQIELINNNRESHNDVEPRPIYQIDGKYAVQLISRLIDSQSCKALFNETDRKIYHEVYLDNPQKKIPNYAEISRAYGTSYKQLMGRIKPMHQWVRSELEKLEKQGNLDKHRLGFL